MHNGGSCLKIRIKNLRINPLNMSSCLMMAVTCSLRFLKLFTKSWECSFFSIHVIYACPKICSLFKLKLEDFYYYCFHSNKKNNYSSVEEDQTLLHVYFGFQPLIMPSTCQRPEVRTWLVDRARLFKSHPKISDSISADRSIFKDKRLDRRPAKINNQKNINQ